MMNAFSMLFVKTNSLPNSHRTDWYLDAIDVDISGATPRADKPVRFSCSMGYDSLFDQAGMMNCGAGHLLIRSRSNSERYFPAFAYTNQ